MPKSPLTPPPPPAPAIPPAPPAVPDAGLLTLHAAVDGRIGTPTTDKRLVYMFPITSALQQLGQRLGVCEELRRFQSRRRPTVIGGCHQSKLALVCSDHNYIGSHGEFLDWPFVP